MRIRSSAIFNLSAAVIFSFVPHAVAGQANAPAAAPGVAATATPKTPPTASNAAGAGAPKHTSEESGPDAYTIGAGDILHIAVWQEPQVSVQSVVVLPDGRITLPLIKDINVAGLTTSDAEKAIADRLSAYIPGADVTVTVSAINSKKIYVIGAVKKEGPIPYTYRMTIMQALSEAGGLTDYAKRRKIYVLRAAHGTERRFPFDYDAVLKGQRMEENISLEPNDTLVIPH